MVLSRNSQRQAHLTPEGIHVPMVITVKSHVKKVSSSLNMTLTLQVVILAFECSEASDPCGAPCILWVSIVHVGVLPTQVNYFCCWIPVSNSRFISHHSPMSSNGRLGHTDHEHLHLCSSGHTNYHKNSSRDPKRWYLLKTVQACSRLLLQSNEQSLMNPGSLCARISPASYL